MPFAETKKSNFRSKLASKRSAVLQKAVESHGDRSPWAPKSFAILEQIATSRARPQRNHKPSRPVAMQSSRCLNREFRPFGMVASAKQPVTAILFAFMLLLSPSLRADIVTVYNQTGFTTVVKYPGSNWGNSFQNADSETKLKSITIYLWNYGYNSSSGYLYAQGTLKLDIFQAAGSSGSWLPTGTSMGTASANRLFTGEFQNENSYTFDFSSLNLNLASGGNYAFRANFTSLDNSDGVWISSNTGSWNGQNSFYDNNLPGGSFKGQVFVETTAVPEPRTLILTGSALLAGAIGVYFTRRHRDQALTPAAV
jgi:hypothetical protein